jgi:hypothetical protein
LKISLYPTVVFFDVQGEGNFHFAGYTQKFHIESASGCVTSGADCCEPQFQCFAQVHTDKLREQGKPVDLRR